GPASRLIKAPNQRQQTVVGGMNMRRQLGDLILQFLDLVVGQGRGYRGGERHDFAVGEVLYYFTVLRPKQQSFMGPKHRLPTVPGWRKLRRIESPPDGNKGAEPMHGTSSQSALRLRITLADIEPPIWRSVIFPRNATLHELHRAIQMLFDWYDYHLYQFEIDGRRFEVPDEEAEGE